MLHALTDPVYLVTLITVFIVSITLHEFGHAVTADILGDPTPRRAGRVTLNPAVHLDVFGSLMILLAGFGWAKPVPVMPHHFKQPRLGNLVVSLAGPAMNFLLAIAALIALKYGGLPDGGQMWLKVAFSLNLILMVFNLLPIPPLDGGHILESVLPRRWLPAYQHLAPYGVVILLVMVFLPGARGPLNWLYGTIRQLMVSLV